MPCFIDYTGRKIGRVQIISLFPKIKKVGASKWNCLCDCGDEFITNSLSFKRGETFECRKCFFERQRGPDLTGRKFGRWTVLERCVDKLNKTVWHCLCDCGNKGYVSTYALGRKSRSMSCGCWGRKIKSKHVNITLYPPSHGLSKSRFYSTKTSLIHKCYNEKHPSYSKFGGSGITVCDLWRNGAKDMYNWAISQGWQEGDVICLKEGAKEFNPQTTFILKHDEFRSQVALKGGYQLTYNGETHSISKWAEILDVNKEQLKRKIEKYPTLDLVFGSEFKKQMFVRDPSLVEKAIELYNQGKSQAEIGKILNTFPQNIRYQLLKNDIVLRKEDIKRPRKPEIKDDQIIKLISEGRSMNSIAKSLNVTFPCIKYRLDKINGVKRDRTKG